MTEAEVAERVRRYILDGGDEDLRRLLKISEVSADMARGAFRKIGVGDGWSAIDCGCGPIGGLAVLAEMVGPAGRVVGVDANEAAVGQARAVTSSLGLDVQVVAGNVHDLDAAELGGPFDLAYTRLFLTHQPDQVRTLRRIAGLLRPGGWLVAQEPLPWPAPRSHPHLESLAAYWHLLHELLEEVQTQAVEDLPRAAREAGLEVVATEGHFQLLDPEVGFELHASTVAAMRQRAVASGRTAESVDDLERQLRTARSSEYLWVSSPFFLDLTLRRPVGDQRAAVRQRAPLGYGAVPETASSRWRGAGP
jgi:SAM-dependent methyltransferase